MTARIGKSKELRAWQELLRGEAHVVRESPALLCQQLANQVAFPRAAEAARVRLARLSRAWLRWLNRPQATGAAEPVTLATLNGSIAIHHVSADGGRVLAEARYSRRTAGAPEELATLRLWEIATGRELVSHYEDAPWCLCAISPTGERFVAIATYPLTESRDEDPRSPTGPFRECELRDVAGGVVRSFSGRMPFQFSPDGRRLLAETGEAEFTVWETASGGELTRLTGSLAALAADGARVFWMNEDGRPTVRDLSSGAEWTPTSAERSALFRRATSPPLRGSFEARSVDGGRIASVEGARIRILEPKTERAISELVGHVAAVSSVAFLPDGSALLSGSRDGTLRLWPLHSGAGDAAAEDPQPLLGTVSAMVFTRDGEGIVCTTTSDEVLRLDARSARPRGRAVALPRGTLRGLSADGELLAEAVEQIVLVVRTRDNERIPLGRPRLKLRYCIFSPDGRRLLSVSDSGDVSLWWTEPGREPARLQEGDGLARPPRCAAFSPDGTVVAGASLSGAVTLWSVATGGFLRYLLGGGLDAEACGFSPDGALVAAAHRSGVTLWSTTSGGRVTDLPARAGATALQFAPSGAHLATGDAVGRVRVHRCADWSLTCEGRCAGGISQLAWAPSGRRLAVAASGTLQIFEPIDFDP